MQKLSERAGEKELSDDVATTRAAVDQNGSVTLICPKDVADDLGIEPGKEVFWRGEQGDASAEVMPADADVLSAD